MKLLQPVQLLTAASGVTCLLVPSPAAKTSLSLAPARSLTSSTSSPTPSSSSSALRAGLRDFVTDPRDENEDGQVPFGLSSNPQRQYQSPPPNGGTFGGFGQRQLPGTGSGNINRGSGTRNIINSGGPVNYIFNNNNNNGYNSDNGFYSVPQPGDAVYPSTMSQQQQSQRQFQQQRAGTVNFSGSGDGYGGNRNTGVPFLQNSGGGTTRGINPVNPKIRSSNTMSSNNFAATSSRPTFSIPRQGAGTFPINARSGSGTNSIRNVYPQYNMNLSNNNVSGSGTSSVFSRPSNYVNPTTRETNRGTFSGSGGGGGGSSTGGGGGSSSRSNYNFASGNVVEQYFEAWNQRNIPLALSCFDNSIYYDDTQFSNPFEGKEQLAKHLFYVADCLPDSFRFVVDGLAVGPSTVPREVTPNTIRAGNARGSSVSRFRRNGNDGSMRELRGNVGGVRGKPYSSIIQVGALWHVENENGPLPFARGCSFYKVDPSTNLIVEGYDFPEPAVVKGGAFGLRILSIASKLIDEPVRVIPFAIWVGYMYIVFFSDGILPGKNALALEKRTWEEVRDLSLNFFYVAPLLKLKFSPVVHPMLEGVFNALLAWAAMFAGFLSDDRSGGSSSNSGLTGRSAYYDRMMENQQMTLSDGTIVIPSVSTTKRNLFPMLPTVIGMQFLTSAFLLPYLFARTSERVAPDGLVTRPLFKEELDAPARIFGESKALGVVMGHVGVFSIYWAFAGRVDKFGPPLWESMKRMESFTKLLSVDRVGSSFIVDLVIFALFQGWLVDDDWKRRGKSMDEDQLLRAFAKFVPFWGLALYLCFRPPLPSYDDFDRNSMEYLRGGGFYGSNSDRRRGFMNNSPNNMRREGGQNRFPRW